MSAADRVYVYVASYLRLRDARTDYQVLTERCAGLIVHTYETTIVSRDLDGKLKIATVQSPAAGKAWLGLAAGELGGLFFPPFLGWDDPGADDDPLALGPFWLGLSPTDLRVIADMLDPSAAAVIVISESELTTVVTDTLRGTFKMFHKLMTTAAWRPLPAPPADVPRIDRRGRLTLR